MGCSYLSLPLVTASRTQVLACIRTTIFRYLWNVINIYQRFDQYMLCYINWMPTCTTINHRISCFHVQELAILRHMPGFITYRVYFFVHICPLYYFIVTFCRIAVSFHNRLTISPYLKFGLDSAWNTGTLYTNLLIWSSVRLHMAWCSALPIYAVNWCVSRWNGRDTMDVIIFFISRPGGLTGVNQLKELFFLIL